MNKAGGHEWTMSSYAGDPPKFSVYMSDRGTMREVSFLGTEQNVAAGAKTMLDVLVAEGLDRRKIAQDRLLEKFAEHIERRRKDEAFHPQITCKFDPDRYR